MAGDDKDDQKIQSGYAHTRKSLIARLDNWEDQRTWDEFYKTYWKLIYSVGLKAGLRSEEAFDLVQETILSIAKQSKKNLYDPEKGSFKSWLMNMTKWRLNDHFRKRKKDTAMDLPDWCDEEGKTSFIDTVEDPKTALIERIWNEEWNNNLTTAVLAKVKAQVSPQQFQIFDCHVIREWSSTKVQERLGVSVSQVYLNKHRVGKIFKKELQKLTADNEE